MELIKALYLKWLDPQEPDSVFTLKENDKIVLNYKNEVPEYNLETLEIAKSFFPNNRHEICVHEGS
jgi:hypothetical protein